MSILRHENDLTWLEWFTTRDSAQSIDKKCQEQLFSTFNVSISKSDCIETLLQHQETVFLQKTNFGSNRVNLFHHLVAIGDTIYDSAEKEFRMIQGLGKATSIATTLDINVLCNIQSDNAVAVPSMTTLLGLTDIDQIDNIATSATVTYRVRNFIPVPPFLLKTILKII